MAVYRIIHQDMAGIFLYMRTSYIVFKYLIIAIIYLLLKKSLPRRKLLWLIAILIPYLGGIYQSFSYNSVGKYMILISSIIIAYSVSYEHRDAMKVRILLFLAGFLSAIGVFAHPLQIFGVAALTFLLFLYQKGCLGVRLKSVLAYVSGGMAEILVVLVPVSLQAGVAATFSGIYELLFLRQNSSSGGGVTFCARFIEIYNAYGHIWVIMTIVFAAALLISCLYRLICKNPLSFRDQILISGGISFLISVHPFMRSDIHIIIGGPLLWLATLSLLIKKEKIYALVAIPCICFFTAELMLVVSGSVTMRSVYLYPVLFAWLYTSFKSSNRTVIAISGAIALATTACVIKSDYNIVYRDKPIQELTYKVPTGIYKGIYTTETNAHDLMELEEYIKANTDSNERVQFRDNILPAAYLMHTKGGISDIRTWDSLRYDLGINNPQKLYRYYKRTNSIPDKIIYVDFGWEKQLSIDDPDWKYNQFVNSYYSKQSDVRLNATFLRVLIYKYNGKFDGDYDRWIMSEGK